jgi:hypothetical protein
LLSYSILIYLYGLAPKKFTTPPTIAEGGGRVVLPFIFFYKVIRAMQIHEPPLVSYRHHDL